MSRNSAAAANTGPPRQSALMDPSDVLGYWIGPARSVAVVAEAKSGLWFRKSFETDREIAGLFLPTMAALRSGLAHEWAQDGPLGRLAAIIALDQFSRNVFRGYKWAFENDHLALSLALLGLALRQDDGMTEPERLFFYLPLEHAEDADIQARSVSHFERLAQTARPEFSAMAADWLDYARRHKAVIDRFGRFPHRNELMNRESSAPELQFLSQPGARF